MTNELKVRTSAPGAKQTTGEVKSLSDALQNVRAQGAKGPLLAGIAAGATTVGINALAGAVGGLGDYFGEAIQDASNLNEAVSKSGQVFGFAADGVEDWAKRGAEAFGLSERAALEAAGTYGNLFQAFGVGRIEATEMSKTLVELAADLASFNNTSLDDALLALRSGLSGETEPLKRYGIAISDARMRTYLMEQGVDDLGATLTPLQKSTASYALIMQDSALAQGDFARTAKDAANQSRILAAEQENLSAEIGERLAPLNKRWLEIQRDGLGVVADAIRLEDAHTQAYERLREQGIEPTKDAVEELARAIYLGTDAIHGFAVQGGGVARGALRQFADAESDASAETKTFAQFMDDATGEAKELEGAIGDLADTITEELFGKAINAGHLAALRKTRDELREDREELKKGSREYKINAGEIAENRAELLDLQIQMKQKEGPLALLGFINRQIDRYGDLDAKARRYIETLQALSAAQVAANIAASILGGSGGGGGNHKARGGPVTKGQAYIVGEERPEVFVPDENGKIIPSVSGLSGSGSIGGGGPMQLDINVNVAGGILTPAASQALMQQIGPAITRYLQSRGVLR